MRLNNRAAGALLAFLLMLFIFGLGYIVTLYAFEKVYRDVNATLPITNATDYQPIKIGITVVRGWIYVLVILTIIAILIASYKKGRTYPFVILMIILLSANAAGVFGQSASAEFLLVNENSSAQSGIYRLVFTSANFTGWYKPTSGSSYNQWIYYFKDDRGNYYYCYPEWYDPDQEIAYIWIKWSLNAYDMRLVSVYTDSDISSSYISASQIFNVLADTFKDSANGWSAGCGASISVAEDVYAGDTVLKVGASDSTYIYKTETIRKD